MAELYRRAFEAEIDRILCFLHGLVNAILDMAYYGPPRNINRDSYDYAAKRDRIIKDTEIMLRGLS